MNGANIEHRLTVLKNDDRGAGYFHLVARAPALAQTARPGQFIHVRCAPGVDPLLRRPFSFFRLRPGAGEVEIYYQVVGRGTELLSQVKPGTELDALGPLGQGFPLSSQAERVLLLGRGMGTAPLVALAEAARNQGTAVHAVLSARSPATLVGDRLLAAWGVDVTTVTDADGTSDPVQVEPLLAAALDQPGMVQAFVCGSRRLAQLLGRLAAARGIPAFVSLEERMGCGLGGCLVCACRTRTAEGETYKRVCKDGPVFPLEEVVL